jgi:hypothetical protein
MKFSDMKESYGGSQAREKKFKNHIKVLAQHLKTIKKPNPATGGQEVTHMYKMWVERRFVGGVWDVLPEGDKLLGLTFPILNVTGNELSYYLTEFEKLPKLNKAVWVDPDEEDYDDNGDSYWD